MLFELAIVKQGRIRLSQSSVFLKLHLSLLRRFLLIDDSGLFPHALGMMDNMLLGGDLRADSRAKFVGARCVKRLIQATFGGHLLISLCTTSLA